MIVVTGAAGFIGRSATAALIAGGHQVRACVRRAGDAIAPGALPVLVADIGVDSSISSALRGARCVLHLAGKAHSNPADAPGLEAEFRRVNVTATESIARAAAAAGVSRFVFVSSIGVNGASTLAGKPFSSADAPAPSDFYARTKLEAEQRLARICDASSMELVIVRPTLVVGADAPGNLGRLADLIRKGVPIPLAVPERRRHLVGVKSLANLLVLSCVHGTAAGRVLLAAEDPALTAAEMATEIADGLQVKPRLWRVPTVVLKTAGKLTGRSRDVARLCESLLVDTTTTQRMLGWESPRAIQAELRELGAALRARPRS